MKNIKFKKRIINKISILSNKTVLVYYLYYHTLFVSSVRVKIFQIKFYVIIAFSFNANMIQD